MIQREKRYVEVDVRFSTEGRLRPLQIIFDKGQVYKIDKIKDICRRAADVGGVGDRYTCMIQGKERELWFALLIVSGSALAVIFVLRRKANRK